MEIKPILLADYLALERFISSYLIGFLGCNTTIPYSFKKAIESESFKKENSKLFIEEGEISGFHLVFVFSSCCFQKGEDFPLCFFIGLEKDFQPSWKEAIRFSNLMRYDSKRLLRTCVSRAKSLNEMKIEARRFKYININLSRWPTKESLKMDSLLYLIYFYKNDDPSKRCAFVHERKMHLSSPFLADSLASMVKFKTWGSMKKWVRSFLFSKDDLLKRFGLNLILKNKNVCQKDKVMKEIMKMEKSYYSKNIAKLVEKKI